MVNKDAEKDNIKTRYSDEELLEFKDIIFKKLDKARDDFEVLNCLPRKMANEC